jgi:hypothetical protein
LQLLPRSEFLEFVNVGAKKLSEMQIECLVAWPIRFLCLALVSADPEIYLP